MASAREAADDRSRTFGLLAIFGIVIAFWIAFWQNGYALTLWARDNTVTSWSPEVFQSVEPLGIIVLSPLAVVLWQFLRSRRAEPSTLGKIFLGMLLTFVAFMLMAMAAFRGGDAGRVSSTWLISAYIIVAAAEICLSPMGLSLVSKVAPARLRGTLMGAWFVATAVGGYLAGFLGVYWERIPHSRFFFIVAAIAILAGIVLLVVKRRLQAALEPTGEARRSAA